MNGVEVIVFQPAAGSIGLRPGIVHYHGGGWMFMSPGEKISVVKRVFHQHIWLLNLKQSGHIIMSHNEII